MAAASSLLKMFFIYYLNQFLVRVLHHDHWIILETMDPSLYTLSLVADATVSVHFLFICSYLHVDMGPETIALQLLQLWQARFLCGNSDFFWQCTYVRTDSCLVSTDCAKSKKGSKTGLKNILKGTVSGDFYWLKEQLKNLKKWGLPIVRKKFCVSVRWLCGHANFQLWSSRKRKKFVTPL